jgi:site-specific recombinase XerD
MKMNSFTDVALEFLDAKRAERYSPATLRSYFSILDAVSIWMNGRDVDIAAITARDIRAYLGSLDSVSGKTVYNHHICLSSLWTFAVDQGYAYDHVVRQVKAPKFAKKRIIPFTEAQVRKILAASKNSRDRAILITLLDTGIRAAELLALGVDDWLPGYLKVMGKGSKERLVPVSPPTEAAIQSQLVGRRVRAAGVDGGDALFATVISGKIMTYTTLQSVMRRLEKYSGVSDIHCHRFRHTFAITYLRNGGDIYTLQKILGHSSLDTVKIYLDIVRSDVTDAHRHASPIINWDIS